MVRYMIRFTVRFRVRVRISVSDRTRVPTNVIGKVWLVTELELGLEFN